MYPGSHIDSVPGKPYLFKFLVASGVRAESLGWNLAKTSLPNHQCSSEKFCACDESTITGHSALHSALDAESLRDEPMREAG
jgi:hypothetical protein